MGWASSPSRTRRPVEERFWALVDRGDKGECWNWTGTCLHGYGIFHVAEGQLGRSRARGLRAHRVAFYLTHGRWPQPNALHGCDNPRCCNAVNPAHVHEGTQALNVRERHERGRDYHASGESNGNHRLTDAQVNDIRQRYRTPSGLTQKQLADEFGCHQSQISNIVRGIQRGGS